MSDHEDRSPVVVLGIVLKRAVALCAMICFFSYGVPREHHPQRASGAFVTANLPYLPGSRIPIDVDGFGPPYDLALLGPGSITQHLYRVPSEPDAPSGTLIAASSAGIAARTIPFAPAPSASSAFVAVASYDLGVVLHDAHPPYAARAVFAIGGAPSDVAIDDGGSLAAGATNGITVGIARLDPWRVEMHENIPFTDELAFDPKSHALYLSNRDVNGAGALTRVTSDGSVMQRVLGLTAEGIAIDPVRRRIYVANVNDGTISIVDADSMVELRRFKAVARVFSLALSRDGSRLYAVSNQSVTSPFASAGSVVEFDVRSALPRIVGQSGPLAFPIGVALDDAHGRVFVTDEHDDDVYVFDARHLRAVHAPLRTCRTPWKPLVTGATLYVPCARADEVDLFDTVSLRREPGAPFHTGGYPLAVAVWQPHAGVVR